jgi:hypothetical protein
MNARTTNTRGFLSNIGANVKYKHKKTPAKRRYFLSFLSVLGKNLV